MALHAELDQERRDKAAFFRASGAPEGLILRMLLLHSTLKKPAWEEDAEDLLFEYGDWTLVPDEALERYGVTRGQLLAKVIDSSGPFTYAKIISVPPPRGWRMALAPVIPIRARAQASPGRRVRSRRRRTSATRRGPPSQEDSEPPRSAGSTYVKPSLDARFRATARYRAPELDLLDLIALSLGWERA